MYDVVVLGAGPAGLCCAHELSEAGYHVCLLEAEEYIGGKTVSWQAYPYTFTSLNSDRPNPSDTIQAVDELLPGEHSFRLYPLNYRNLMSIMERIPLDGLDHRLGNVMQNLVQRIQFATFVPTDLRANLTSRQKWVSLLELILLGLGLYVPYMLCDERAILKYDELTFGDLMSYDKRTPEMKQFLDRICGSATSGNPRLMSAISTINLMLNYRISPRHGAIRTFQLPTTVGWLTPWKRYLQSAERQGKPVDIKTGHRVTGFTFDRPAASTVNERDRATKIASIRTSQGEISGKYYVSTIPANMLAELIEQQLEILRYEPRLAHISQIKTLPATGVQLFYETLIPEIGPRGFGFQMIDHPWELSICMQNQYWSPMANEAFTQPNGRPRQVVTIYAAVIYARGVLFNKPMLECTPQEIAIEMFTAFEKLLAEHYPQLSLPKRWAFYCHNFTKQLRPIPRPVTQREIAAAHRDERQGVPYYTRPALHFTDADVIDPKHVDSMHLCVPKMYQLRPPADRWYMHNLLIAGAYAQVKTYHVSTMEGAAEAGRLAASTIFTRDGRAPLHIYTEPQLPGLVKLSRRIDRFLYKWHLPNPLNWLLKLFQRVDSSSAHIHPYVYEATDFK